MANHRTTYGQLRHSFKSIQSKSSLADQFNYLFFFTGTFIKPISCMVRICVALHQSVVNDHHAKLAHSVNMIDKDCFGNNIKELYTGLDDWTHLDKRPMG